MGLPRSLCVLISLVLLCALMLLRVVSITFTPTDVYLIDCGATENISLDNREWQRDSRSQYVSTSREILASASTQNNSLLSGVSVRNILLTARIFKDPSKYSFPVNPGRHWIRLYFFPFKYQTFDLTSAVFSVATDGFVLLNNYNVPRAMNSSNIPYLFKEYSVNVTSHILSIYFTPASKSFAFINALEVVSMPSDIILDDSSPLGTNAPVPIGMQYNALVTMYRVNVGGPVVTPANDSLGRTWQANETFLKSTVGVQPVSILSNKIDYPSSIPNYFAPPTVYSTAIQLVSSNTAQPNFNISWIFPIDPSFLYIVRLHFCEIVYTSQSQRIFNVYLQKQSAFTNLDVVQQTGGSYDSAYYRDFTVNASDVGDTSLQLDIGPTPNAGVNNNNAILNGLEIWKLNNSAGSLDGIAGFLPHSRSKGKIGLIVGMVLGAAVAILFLSVGFLLFCHQKSKETKLSSPGWLPLPIHGGNSASMGSKISTASHKSGTGSCVSSAPSSLGRYFTFAEIQDATNNFDEALVLGVGGFGKVYKGEIDGMKVAVKRGNPRSEQGLTEFQTEIEMLSKLRHRHLVSLIGYCEEHCEMILVYEYMAKGPLRSHLYGSDLPPLSWRQRLDICIGAARGLHYLHTGAAQGIIHRDVKTTNILLDENLVAKVSDFGLSKTGPTLDRTHVSTAVKGSFGYLDPEYFRRQQLTEKSDVYSFGVVLMEVLCARPAINPTLPRDQVNIAEWAMHWQKKGILDEIVDPHLNGTINIESLKKFGETAEKCLAEQGIDRPSMGDVLWNLEYTLQLQETAMSNNLDEDSANRILALPIRIPAQEHWDTSAVENQGLESDVESEDISTSAVFSQLVNPHGR
eukprot:c26906_g2_i1 orf=734-3301(-)